MLMTFFLSFHIQWNQAKQKLRRTKSGESIKWKKGIQIFTTQQCFQVGHLIEFWEIHNTYNSNPVPLFNKSNYYKNWKRISLYCILLCTSTRVTFTNNEIVEFCKELLRILNIALSFFPGNKLYPYRYSLARYSLMHSISLKQASDGFNEKQ
jgi:hypothetical protein